MTPHYNESQRIWVATDSCVRNGKYSCIDYVSGKIRYTYFGACSPSLADPEDVFPDEHSAELQHLRKAIAYHKREIAKKEAKLEKLLSQTI